MNAVADTGLGVRALSSIEIGVLKDLGFTVTTPTVLLFVGFVFLLRRKRFNCREMESFRTFPAGVFAPGGPRSGLPWL
jgi:hypothetical protein